jgi:hypothetical protein
MASWNPESEYTSACRSEIGWNGLVGYHLDGDSGSRCVSVFPQARDSAVGPHRSLYRMTALL